MELKYEFYIDGTPEQVWDAIVSPEGTRNLFFGCVIRSSFQVGEPFEYVGPGPDGDETVHLFGEILAFEPHKRFRFREHPGPSYYPNYSELASTITFTLEPVGTCTKLTLVENEWTDNHPAIQKSEALWWMILSNLKTYVETGRTLNFGW